MIKLIHGDCLKELSNLDFPDLILADMPYGSTQCQWDTPIDLNVLWPLLDRVAKNVPVILFAQSPFDKILGASNIKNLRYEWVWEKTKASGFLNARRMPLRAHENILVFCNKAVLYFPQMSEGEAYDKGVRSQRDGDDNYGSFSSKRIKSNGGRFPRSVIKFRTAEAEGGYHRTQKPVALLEYLIQTYTNEGDKVLDFCMGSGSTGIACLNTSRRFIGIENDKEIFDIAKERISKHRTLLNVPEDNDEKT